MSLVNVENVDQAAVLRTLNLNPGDPHTQAVLLICQRYSLDPLLKHVVLIQGRPYITRDGYLSIAHDSGKFDGIEILDEGETPVFWWARAAVHRKDMGRPFIYRGRYPKQGAGNPKYGPEMAVKTAEVMALRRAFNVTGVPAAEEAWDSETELPARTLSSVAAKGRLLTAAGGDKEAAAAAWDKAGLKDRREVSEAEIEAAETELRDLAWSWAKPGDDHGPGGPSGSDAEDTGMEPGSGAPPGSSNPAAGPAPMGTAAEAGDAGSETSAGSAAGEPADHLLNTPRAVAIKAGHVFMADYDGAPRGAKTKVAERLRHALVYATTGGQVASTNDCTPSQLFQVWQGLEDITAGRLAYTADQDDDAGVTFTWQSGKETTVLWSDLEAVDAEVGTEP